MSPRHTSTPELPGNDGAWFLELVGLTPASPSLEDTLATLAPVQTVAVDERSSTTGLIAAVDLDPADTSTHTTAVTEATPPVAIVPESLPTPPRDHRIRWSIVIPTVLVAVGVAALALWLPARTRAEAAVLAGRYRTAVMELRNALPDAQAALADLTDPDTDPERLADVVPAAAAFQATAGRLADLASQPLPATPPLVPRAPLDALEPGRERMGVLAAEGDLIARRLARGFTYRTTIPRLLGVPALPTTADDATRDDLAVQLAASLATATELLGELRDDPAFTSTAFAARAAVEELPSWQDRYLAALAGGDVDAAGSAVAELEASRRALDATLTADLLTLRSDLDRRIIELAAAAEELLAAMP